MEKCYNWNDNTLKFSDKNGNKINLKFKWDKTIVSGESATGKTFICASLQKFKKDKNKALSLYNTDNIFILTEDNYDKLEMQKEKLIIIDRAEFILNKDMVNIINKDINNNRYLIFLRKPMGIELSPNHFADLKTDKDTNEIILEYHFDIKWWY